MKTKDKRIAIEQVIAMLSEWMEYTSELNECAYSDSMLDNAAKKLDKANQI